ncbi:MAG: hypothetical protein J6T67_06570 [Paludibacteraceae bacterium]|nr:hypothetical protein [Paludibacteraceae bacterium]
MSKIRTIILITAFIPFFSSCSKICDGLMDLLGSASHKVKDVVHEKMKEDTTQSPFEGCEILKIERHILYDNHTFEYVFPYIQMEDREVERKVNAILQMENFDVVFNGPDGSCVDGIDHIARCFRGDGPTKFYDNSFSRNLSIEIVNKPNFDWQKIKYHYNFNPKTGDLYHLEDFFSEENYRLFQSKLFGYEMYSLKNLSNFEFTQDKIIVRLYRYTFIGKLFNKYSYYEINISDIEPLLNDYGRAALITGEGLEKYHSNLSLLYEGTIGDEPVYYYGGYSYGQLFFKNTGKFGWNEEVHFLNFPEGKENSPDSLRCSDSCWYDCRFRIKHIESLFSNGLVEDYKDCGYDLFCYHVTEDGLEGYYQTPYPPDHDLKVKRFDFVREENIEDIYIKSIEEYKEEYKSRIEEYGVNPQKYKVKLKKL